MENKVLNGITPGGRREILGEALPLSTPFLVQMFPVYGCNFRCGYCLHALPKFEHGYISDKAYMDIEFYKKCIDDMRGFKKQIKMLRFAGIGEPLLHKNITEMIKYAKECNVAKSVDIVTNGVLLNQELSLKLIDAGLDKLRISIQGISKEQYKELSNVDLDFSNFKREIEFFYKNRKETKVYIKIIDCALTDKTQERVFFEMFEEMCDFIAIEHLTPTVAGIDYGKIARGKNPDVTQSGNALSNVSICPQPFYMMQINPDGKVVPCCSMSYPTVIGDALKESVVEIWNGTAFNRFRRSLLDGVHNAGDICSNCVLYRYGLFQEDILDQYVYSLKEVY